MRLCSVEGCGEAYSCKGLCARHYERMRRNGDPTRLQPRGPAPIPASGRFFKHIKETAGCWLWVGGVSSSGYGVFLGDNKKNMSAHRWSYAYHKGPIPEGLVINHLCEVRNCVNPAHLEVCTHTANLRYSINEERCSRGHLKVFRRGNKCRECENITQRARRAARGNR